MRSDSTSRNLTVAPEEAASGTKTRAKSDRHRSNPDPKGRTTLKKSATKGDFLTPPKSGKENNEDAFLDADSPLPSDLDEDVFTARMHQIIGPDDSAPEVPTQARNGLTIGGAPTNGSTVIDISEQLQAMLDLSSYAKYGKASKSSTLCARASSDAIKHAQISRDKSHAPPTRELADAPTVGCVPISEVMLPVGKDLKPKRIDVMIEDFPEGMPFRGLMFRIARARHQLLAITEGQNFGSYTRGSIAIALALIFLKWGRKASTGSNLSVLPAYTQLQAWGVNPTSMLGRLLAIALAIRLTMTRWLQTLLQLSPSSAPRWELRCNGVIEPPLYVSDGVEDIGSRETRFKAGAVLFLDGSDPTFFEQLDLNRYDVTNCVVHKMRPYDEFQTYRKRVAPNSEEWQAPGRHPGLITTFETKAGTYCIIRETRDTTTFQRYFQPFRAALNWDTGTNTPALEEVLKRIAPKYALTMIMQKEPHYSKVHEELTALELQQAIIVHTMLNTVLPHVAEKDWPKVSALVPAEVVDKLTAIAPQDPSAMAACAMLLFEYREEICQSHDVVDGYVKGDHVIEHIIRLLGTDFDKVAHEQLPTPVYQALHLFMDMRMVNPKDSVLAEVMIPGAGGFREDLFRLEQPKEINPEYVGKGLIDPHYLALSAMDQTIDWLIHLSALQRQPMFIHAAGRLIISGFVTALRLQYVINMWAMLNKTRRDFINDMCATFKLQPPFVIASMGFACLGTKDNWILLIPSINYDLVTDEEFNAIVAHEIGHIVHETTMQMLFGRMGLLYSQVHEIWSDEFAMTQVCPCGLLRGLARVHCGGLQCAPDALDELVVDCATMKAAAWQNVISLLIMPHELLSKRFRRGLRHLWVHGHHETCTTKEAFFGVLKPERDKTKHLYEMKWTTFQGIKPNSEL